VVPVPLSPISVNLRYRFICCLFRIAQFERTPEARLEALIFWRYGLMGWSSRARCREGSDRAYGIDLPRKRKPQIGKTAAHSISWR